jgi:hypothetical protein
MQYMSDVHDKVDPMLKKRWIGPPTEEPTGEEDPTPPHSTLHTVRHTRPSLSIAHLLGRGDFVRDLERHVRAKQQEDAVVEDADEAIHRENLTHTCISGLGARDGEADGRRRRN